MNLVTVMRREATRVASDERDPVRRQELEKLRKFVPACLVTEPPAFTKRSNV